MYASAKNGSGGFSATVMVGGLPVREAKGSVSVPFGSEYVVRLKNSTAKKAAAFVYADGIAVTVPFVEVGPGCAVDVSRWAQSESDASPALRFTKAGDGGPSVDADASTVRVEWFHDVQKSVTEELDNFRKPYPYPYPVPVYPMPYYPAPRWEWEPYNPYPWRSPQIWCTTGGTTARGYSGPVSVASRDQSAFSCCASTGISAQCDASGLTGEGESISTERLSDDVRPASRKACDDIVIRLCGE